MVRPRAGAGFGAIGAFNIETSGKGEFVKETKKRSNGRRGAIVAMVGALSIGLLSMTPIAAWSADSNRFDTQAFRAAQAAGKPVLVDVYADW